MSRHASANAARSGATSVLTSALSAASFSAVSIRRALPIPTAATRAFAATPSSQYVPPSPRTTGSEPPNGRATSSSASRSPTNRSFG
jgi:hypothetical protein